MPAKKQTKPSRKPTNKDNNLPESVQWLLKFLNLRSMPGKQNLNKLPVDVRKELKCPPLHPGLGVEQCSPTLEDFKQFFLKEWIPPKKGTELLLENGRSLESLNTEVKYPETWYMPTYDNYPFELKLFVQISELWGEFCRILGNMIHGTKTYDNEGTAEESFNHFKKTITEKYIECLDDDEIPDKGGYSKNRGADFRGIRDVIVGGVFEIDSFPHYGMLPQALYASILDFSCNHKKRLSRLRQCPLCGTFFYPKQRGRPSDYCTNECKKVFTRRPRNVDKALKASSRKRIKKVTMKIAKKEIIDWLRTFDFAREEAEEEYEKEKSSNPNNVASLKAFQNSYGRRFGLLKQSKNNKG